MLAGNLKLYRPLLIIFGVCLLGAAALSFRMGNFGNLLMGLFLLFLAVLQLFDWHGFAMSFRRYDVLAARSTLYARIYPFIEIALGIFYLSGVAPLLTNSIMVGIMFIGIIGVARTMRRGEALHCACAGTAFALPVGWVTILEDGVMGAMAAANLIALLHH